MEDVPQFRRYSTSTLPEGEYTIRVEFVNIPRADYKMICKGGSLITSFRFTDSNDAAHIIPLVFNPSDLIECANPSVNFEIVDCLPNPQSITRSNKNLIHNLIPEKVVNIYNKFGYTVNGRVYLKENGTRDWSNFPNFLVDYLLMKFGSQWIGREWHKRDNEIHPFVRLYKIFKRQLDDMPSDSTNCKQIPVKGGVITWFMDFAYNVYWVDNNGGVNDPTLARLRDKTHFWSTVHEVFVAAIFARAGFEISFEDESDRSQKHPEFFATHRETGEIVTVEAKALHRKQIANFKFSDWTINNVRVGRLFNNATKKIKLHSHFIVIDLHIPPQLSNEEQIRFNDRFAKFLDHIHPNASQHNRDHWNAIYFVNRPFLFTEGSDHPAIFSFANGTTNYPLNPHPSMAVIQSINEAFNSMANIYKEMELLTELTKRVIDDHKIGFTWL